MPTTRKAASIRVEDRGDVLHVLCADCGEHVDVTYLGIIARVPYVGIECSRCGSFGKRKLVPERWHALPETPA